MLVSLHVKNMALIKEVEVEFGEGLNIMTGETGAGKSIVIGSVNIALGTGNFKDYVPEDADYAARECRSGLPQARAQRRPAPSRH